MRSTVCRNCAVEFTPSGRRGPVPTRCDSCRRTAEHERGQRRRSTPDARRTERGRSHRRRRAVGVESRPAYRVPTAAQLLLVSEREAADAGLYPVAPYTKFEKLDPAWQWARGQIDRAYDGIGSTATRVLHVIGSRTYPAMVDGPSPAPTAPYLVRKEQERAQEALRARLKPQRGACLECRRHGLMRACGPSAHGRITRGGRWLISHVGGTAQ